MGTDGRDDHAGHAGMDHACPCRKGVGSAAGGRGNDDTWRESGLKESRLDYFKTKLCCLDKPPRRSLKGQLISMTHKTTYTVACKQLVVSDREPPSAH